jgi:DNA-binding NtrC family response regulator
MKQALILNDDRTQLAAQTCELIRNGFYVINAASLTEGLEYARLGQIDLVVMCERINSQLTHTVALTAEQKNPDVVTILITDRNDSDIDEVFDLLPSLTTLIGTEISMFTFSKILGCEKSPLRPKLFGRYASG